MQLSNGKRNHTIKRDPGLSSSGSPSCSGNEGFSPQYTYLIQPTKQSNLNSAQGLVNVKVMGDSRTYQHFLTVLMM